MHGSAGHTEYISKEKMIERDRGQKERENFLLFCSDMCVLVHVTTRYYSIPGSKGRWAVDSANRTPVAAETPGLCEAARAAFH